MTNATIQPMTVQPTRRLSSPIIPAFALPLVAAMAHGRKYATVITVRIRTSGSSRR
jgi:hypothetical protein